jgi:hypothetical protein
MKTTAFDRTNLKDIRSRLDKALNEVGTELGIGFVLGNISFTTTNFRVRLEANLVGSVGAGSTSPEEAEEKAGAAVFSLFCGRYGLKVDDLGRAFTFRAHQYKITGISNNKPKYPILATRLPDGKRFKFAPHDVVLGLGRKRTQEDILNDLRRVENCLEPESLSCDGEISLAQVRRRRALLVQERSQLIGELGREPSFEELFPSK